MNTPSGMHPDAWVAWQKAGIPASRIGQTIGNAAASAGTHARDGTADGHGYCAATDVRVRDLDRAEVIALAQKLAAVGFAAFVRIPGEDHWPATEVRHIHAVYAGCAMKEALRHQVHDFCHGLNGLASHAAYHCYTPSPESVQTVRTLFLAHNPAVG
jgi:hypothetical protein